LARNVSVELSIEQQATSTASSEQHQRRAAASNISVKHIGRRAGGVKKELDSYSKERLTQVKEKADVLTVLLTGSIASQGPNPLLSSKIHVKPRMIQHVRDSYPV
jgi:hypothetical protein